MDAYSCYRLIINLKSSFGTPWQADTIMGHLAWLVAYREGDEGVRDFLASFVEGNPPFVISDGFPVDLLPRPLRPARTIPAADVDSYVAERMRRKAEFLKIGDFQAIRLGRDIELEPISSPWVSTETLHAAISRETGTTGSGGNLFMTESWVLSREFLKNDQALISIYTYCRDEWSERFEKMFKELALVGFGRDKSVGLGHFEVFKREKWDGFDLFDNANGFISLSTFVPGADDPTEGRWGISTKYGKLGEFAGNGYPFKKPLLQIRPGSVFYTGGKPRPFYGRVVEGIAPGFPRAVQVCYCLAVPCHLQTSNSQISDR